MVNINEKLRKAAEKGSEVKLQALLGEPGCDALSKSKSGMTALMCAAHRGNEAGIRLLLPVSDPLSRSVNKMTALMWAARYGQAACVRLLLPVSDALSSGLNEMTASDWARIRGAEGVAEFIDAYALAQSERNAMGASLKSGSPRGRPTPRV